MIFLSKEVKIDPTNHQDVGDDEDNEDIILVLYCIETIHVNPAHYDIDKHHSNSVLLRSILTFIPRVPKSNQLEKQLNIYSCSYAPVEPVVA